MWRRFDEVLEVPLPTRDQTVQLLSRLFIGHASNVDLDRVAAALDGYPQSAAEALVHAALRSAVAGNRTTAVADDVEVAVRAITSRRWR